MDDVVGALAAQQDELSGILDGLTDDDWRVPTRCEGWDVADVVLHLAQTDEMALLSASGRMAPAGTAFRRAPGAVTVDDAATIMVGRERGAPVADLRTRWSTGAARLLEELRGMDLSSRVTWVAGELSARTLTTTRLAETWIHTGDVADAVGLGLPPTGRLRLIARLAWRTLPYAFSSAGQEPSGPVAFRLTGPAGEAWDFVPEEPEITTISGPATDLCAVAARRVAPPDTSLRGEGPDAAEVLALVRTYA